MPKIIIDEQIFQAVIEIVSERGYAGATTRQIAEAAGISEVTLFRKYGTKAELVRRAIGALIAQTDFQSATHYSGNIQTDLLRILNAYQDTVVLHGRFFFVLFSEISRNPELAASFDQPLGLFQAIGQLLARYQSEKVLTPENPLHAVASLLGPLMYIASIKSMVMNISASPIDLEAHIAYFLNGRSILRYNLMRTGDDSKRPDKSAYVEEMIALSGLDSRDNQRNLLPK